MPLYRFAIRPGLTSAPQREQIAKEVVRVHCGATGAPARFVHAFFREAAEGELPDGRAAFVLGSIRAGRTSEQRARIASELGEALARITGCEPAEVAVVTVDVPSKWIMEGGELMPEPGQEGDWLARHGAS